MAAPVGTSIDMATTNNTPVRLAITAHHGVEIVLGQVFILAKDLHAVQGLHLHNIVGWWRGAVWMAYRQAKRLSVNYGILFQYSLDNVLLQRRNIPLHLQCWVVGGLCVCVCVYMCEWCQATHPNHASHAYPVLFEGLVVGSGGIQDKHRICTLLVRLVFMIHVGVHTVNGLAIWTECLQQGKPRPQAGGTHHIQVALGRAAKVQTGQEHDVGPRRMKEGQHG